MVFALVLAAWPVPHAAAQIVTTRPGATKPDTAKLYALALVETMLLNVVVNRFDALVLKEDWAHPTPEIWKHNLKTGWEWDEDLFTTNMFAHPYHGNLYFNGGRANGLNFWESMPVALFGSWNWEYFGETHRPSLNDWFMTSIGGFALGEVTHNLAATVRNNTLRGGARTRSEIFAMMLDPMGGLHRLFRGQWNDVTPNPVEHAPEAIALRLNVGARFADAATDTTLADDGGSNFAFIVELRSSDPFDLEYTRPFDAFNVRAVVSGGLNQVDAYGRLYSGGLPDSTKSTRHLFAINQVFDYLNNPAQRAGGQSVEGGFYSKFALKGDWGIRSHTFAQLMILGAVDAPYGGFGERIYDYGSGGGARLRLTLEKRSLPWVTLFGKWTFISSVSGADADHKLGAAGIEVDIPVWQGWGVAAHGGVYWRNSRYSSGLRDKRDFPELRILAFWSPIGTRQ